MKSKNKNTKTTTQQKEFELTPNQIRTDKILAIIYAIWSLTNVVIFLFHFTDQQFEELFPFTSLDWKYYNFFTLIIFAFFIPEIIHFIIKHYRILQHEKKSSNNQ